MNKFDEKEIIGIVALLIHAAKIDEIYSEKEKEIIFNFINKNLKDNTLSEKIMNEAEKFENNSNQLLNYTKVIKESSMENKSKL